MNTRHQARPAGPFPVFRAVSSAALAALTCWAAGCLNPSFVNQVSSGSVTPLAPGDVPFVLVRCVNLTRTAEIDAVVGFEAPGFFGYDAVTLAGIHPNGGDVGAILPCPVASVRIGDPSAPAAPAVTVTRDDDTAYSMPSAAFPIVLADGVNYTCGDTVIFTFVDAPSSPYGIDVSAGRIEGSTQTGPFSGTDSFEVLQLMLFANGHGPTPIP